MTRWLAGTAASASLLFIGTAAPAHASTARCGSAPVVRLAHGVAYPRDIRATRITCRRARTVARACTANHLTGWTKLFEPTDNGQGVARVVLERGQARVTFDLVGPTNGCIRP